MGGAAGWGFEGGRRPHTQTVLPVARKQQEGKAKAAEGFAAVLLSIMNPSTTRAHTREKLRNHDSGHGLSSRANPSPFAPTWSALRRRKLMLLRLRHFSRKFGLFACLERTHPRPSRAVITSTNLSSAIKTWTRGTLSQVARVEGFTCTMTNVLHCLS